MTEETDRPRILRAIKKCLDDGDEFWLEQPPGGARDFLRALEVDGNLFSHGMQACVTGISPISVMAGILANTTLRAIIG